ncbi:MAG: glycosyltransferase family 4 protein [Planctomycetes bacterium]|nr:glycosyltransferase family 4 protein [Planctomycetota bacterium]
MAAEPNSSADKGAAALHVLHVAERDFFARFGRFFRHLALGLEQEDVRVSLLTDDAEALTDLETSPVECQYVAHISGWRSWRLHNVLDARVDPLPTLVHVWGTPSLAPISEWTRRRGLMLLVHALSTGDAERLVQRGPRRGEHLAGACTQFCERLRRHSRTFADRVHYLPPGLMLPEEMVGVSAVEDILGVIWSGRMEAGSGLDVLVEAVAHLRAKGCELQVALVGEGTGAQEVWRDIRRRQARASISLVDEPKLWDQAMRGADVCVVPACQHELSLAPLLAMALGKVVIASRDQVADWFVEDQTAWQFTPGAMVELAYHLLHVAERHKKVRELTDSAVAYVGQHHSLTALTQRLIAVYRAVLAADDAAVGGQPRARGNESNGRRR